MAGNDDRVPNTESVRLRPRPEDPSGPLPRRFTAETLAPTSVAICIPTYRRPIFLGRLLQSVAELQTRELRTWTIVVDNDAAGSAEPIVRRFSGRIPGLIYEIEPRRGIAAARNRLVAIAGRLGAEYVAFVDDDDRVEPLWLLNLVRIAQTSAAAVVGGAVVPEFDPEIPGWLRSGGFFHFRRYRTGQEVQLTGGSNVLLRRAWLDRLDGPFDRRFDLTGGEDSHMLMRLHRLGARMVWCDEAVVHERIPASRGSPRWILTRRLRIGMTSARRQALLEPGIRRRAIRIARAVAGLRRPLGRLPQAILRRKRREILRLLWRCSTKVGTVLGSLGFSYEEYRRLHGR